MEDVDFCQVLSFCLVIGLQVLSFSKITNKSGASVSRIRYDDDSNFVSLRSKEGN